MSVLWGSTSAATVNPASLFTIEETSGLATYIGHNGLAEGNERISAIDFDPTTGILYGIKGGPCYGALLVTLDPLTGAATLVDTLMGGWFDGTPGPNCPGGSSGIAFAADGTLYASGWYGGTPQGKIMRVDKTTATVLEVHPTPLGYDDWRGRRAHINGLAFDANGVLWGSRGNSITRAQINTVDPLTGNITGTLYLNDPVMTDSLTISDLAFGPDGKLYASLPWEAMLAEIDTATGSVTRIGSFGADVWPMGGLTAMYRAPPQPLGRYWFNEAISGQAPPQVLDDTPNPVHLSITYVNELQWTELGGHRGLNSSSFGHGGIAGGPALGNKYEVLHFSPELTLEIVVAYVQPTIYTATIGGFQTDRRISRRAAVMLADTNGRPIAQFRTRNSNNLQVRWPMNLGDNVRRVYHIVYESSHPTANKRIRMYIDGVDQGVGELIAGNWPGLGEELRWNLNDLALQVINYPFLIWQLPMQGTVFYFGVYNEALNDTEAAYYANSLATDDDNL
jgi:hypothetical protein